MRCTVPFLPLLPALLSAFVAASPVEDLSSVDPEIRDNAAAELRISFQNIPESKWTPTIDKIKKGQSKKEILEILRPFQVTPEGGASGGGSYSNSFRLDDGWILTCWFTQHEDVLIDRKLGPSIRQIGVGAPKNYNGQWVSYFVNGNKSYEAHLKDGRCSGKLIGYHQNGTKAVVQHYTDDVANGDDTGYYPSGSIAYRGQYKDGKQVGTWTWYDEAGKVTTNRELKTP